MRYKGPWFICIFLASVTGWMMVPFINTEEIVTCSSPSWKYESGTSKRGAK